MKMILERDDHRITRTQLVFPAANARVIGGTRERGTVVLGFRSDREEEPLLVLESVVYSPDSTNRPPRDPVRFRLAKPVVDRLGRYRLQSFQALRTRIRAGEEELAPFPMVTITEQIRTAHRSCQLWSLSGLDPLLPTQAELRFAGADAIATVVRGEQPAIEAIAREHFGTELADLPTPEYLSFPDVFISVARQGPEPDIDAAHLRMVCLAMLLEIMNGQPLRVDSVRFRSSPKLVARQFCLAESGDTTPPFSRGMRCLAPSHKQVSAVVFTDCWARVEMLLSRGFKFPHVVGWYLRSRRADQPIEQKFASQFLFLEALGWQWVRAKHGMSSTGTLAKIDSAIRDLTGRRYTPQVRAIRNNIIHEGNTNLPIGERARFLELMDNLCNQLVASLIDWPHQFEQFRRLRRTTEAGKWRRSKPSRQLP